MHKFVLNAAGPTGPRGVDGTSTDGEAGPPGQPGPAGPTGPTGLPGTTNDFDGTNIYGTIVTFTCLSDGSTTFTSVCNWDGMWTTILGSCPPPG